MKLLVAVLTILISTNLLSAEKASRGDLLEAFDGKFVLVEGQSKRLMIFNNKKPACSGFLLIV